MTVMQECQGCLLEYPVHALHRRCANSAGNSLFWITRK